MFFFKARHETERQLIKKGKGTLQYGSGLGARKKPPEHSAITSDIFIAPAFPPLCFSGFVSPNALLDDARVTEGLLHMTFLATLT